MKIRKASMKDFDELYRIGLNTPELRVSRTEPFMEEDDFKRRIKDRRHVFLLAADKGKIAGFICANTKDMDSYLAHKWACIIYVVVIQDYRNKGVGSALYEECAKQLKKRGITHVYTWANAESRAIQKFMKSHGFKSGEKYVWMDSRL